MVKSLPALQNTRVRSLGQENPLEKEMATDPSILAWRIPWTRDWQAIPSGVAKELDMTEQLTHIKTIKGEGIHICWGEYIFK